jgi:hypothetical protein
MIAILDGDKSLEIVALHFQRLPDYQAKWHDQITARFSNILGFFGVIKDA